MRAAVYKRRMAGNVENGITKWNNKYNQRRLFKLYKMHL